MMSLWDALRMNMMISYQELVRTFLSVRYAFLYFFLFLLHGSFPGEKRTFKKIHDDIKNKIVDNLTPEQQQEWFHDLLIVEKKRKSLVGIIKTTFIFLACYGFYFMSLYYFIQHWHSDKVTACI